jgi:hypothetical protein
MGCYRQYGRPRRSGISSWCFSSPRFTVTLNPSAISISSLIRVTLIRILIFGLDDGRRRPFKCTSRWVMKVLVMPPPRRTSGCWTWSSYATARALIFGLDGGRWLAYNPSSRIEFGVRRCRCGTLTNAGTGARCDRQSNSLELDGRNIISVFHHGLQSP